MQEDNYSAEREQMVDSQIAWRGVRSARVLQAMRDVPRHLFVSAGMRPLAYADCALPIQCGQTISQPYIVALMTSLLALQGDETVLEVGTGSGYQSAVLARLARRVVSIEYIPELAETARALFESLKIDNVDVVCADGSQGYPPGAPYDAILVTAAAPEVPTALFEQLKPLGRLVLPVGRRGTQDLQLWGQEQGVWQCESILPVAFVPLRGEAGWSASKWTEE
jgi:protein-L-isoaspartate(D-aspartate) O-methyltransferase